MGRAFQARKNTCKKQAWPVGEPAHRATWQEQVSRKKVRELEGGSYNEGPIGHYKEFCFYTEKHETSLQDSEHRSDHDQTHIFKVSS